MNGKYNFKLIVVFFVAFSLVSLAGPMSSPFHFPAIQLAHAPAQPCQTHGASGACSEFWVPAGPSMNSEVAVVFTDGIAEFTNIQSASPSIDFTDSPLPSSVCPILQFCNFLISAPIGEVTYYEIDFHLANSFWGCQFNFGNAACGAQIRQGIAHMMDKRSFTNTDPNIAGHSAPIDNPLPTNTGGGLLTPNPCAYDASFSQSGGKCVVGAAGGLSYHLANATGANGISWLQAPGSADLNAAAQHFVNAGLAAGFNSTTSVLTGISSIATSDVPNFFIRSDDPARLDLGNGLSEQICYLFTGSYTVPCPYLSIVRGPITAFPGLVTSSCPTPGPGTCTTGVSLNWWMYTAGFTNVPSFDSSLFYTYNSRFVSGIPSIIPPCSTNAVPTATARNYMYLCSPNYDSISNKMESAPCLNTPGDPASGQASNFPTPPIGGICAGTSSQLSAHSAGIQAEAMFGGNAFTIPIFERIAQYGYLNNGWTQAINSDDHGIPNHFTWLNAWNPTATQPWTIRQGFSETTKSLNPFIATTVHDLYNVNNVYDSLYKPNPLAPSQTLDWMTIGTFQKDNASLGYPSGLQAPPHTLTTYRFTLRGDLFFQDGTLATSYDAAFSYLSMVGQGAFLGTGATPMTGITILGPHQFDIGVSSLGPFTLPNLASIPIVPGRYWTNSGSSSWDAASAACTSITGCPFSQYTLTGPNVNCISGCTPFSGSLMTINPADTAATFDPVVAHTFVGSGPYECGLVTSSGSGTCTTSGEQNAPVGGSYTLTRFGSGLSPASSVSGFYVRAASTAALWIWSRQNDITPSTIFSSVAFCYLKPVDLTGPCGHFQHGIGIIQPPGPVSPVQIAIENRFYGLNWVRPFDWRTNPPTGIVPFPPVLHEGNSTLNPCSIDPVNGYDC